MVWAVLLQRFQCFKDTTKSSDDRTCEICFETIPASKQFKSIRCSHRFCCECISRYIETKVTDDNVVLITCPQVGCKVTIKPLKCRTILRPETFIRWCDYYFFFFIERGGASQLIKT
ncbi:hypothetical protein QJS04_geneDACA024143 [Acorus gramineus]|uniref:RING-type domain-containing protein n=1 Tax=Acorus gramineus TaxID=55184 RepID=A0AAV9BWL0_ACOGR|nr:hypothetical protein QJS04_geneDACA024143 [Acorus gramineus]